MTKFHALTLAAAAAIAAVSSPALSQQKEIVVSSENAMTQVTEDLDRQLEIAGRFHDRGYGNGFAIIRFERGADGRPTNVRFFRHSGNDRLDRVAHTAVRRLGSKVGLPETGTAGQKYQANVILATSPNSLQRLAAELAKFEKQRLASSPAERNVIALSAGSHIAS